MTTRVAPTDLTADAVSKVYGEKRTQRIHAVDDVSVTVTSNSRLGIVGESGSGKSTLARLLVGLETPTRGAVLYDGVPQTSFSRGDWRAFRRAVQLVAQDTSSSFDPRRTLRDAVATPVRRLLGLSGPDVDGRVERTLETLSLSAGLADRHPHEVSGGQRQRFALARALVVEPRVLLCDEVVSALDVSVQGSILNLLKDYCADHDAGLVFVSHGLAATAFISEQLAVMHRGRLVELGATSRVIAAPAHPYTASLLAAVAGRTAAPATTDTPTTAAGDATRAEWACRFAPWCPRATSVCQRERPPLREHRGVHVACHDPVENTRLVGVGAGAAPLEGSTHA